MKSFVLSAMIGAAVAGNATANETTITLPKENNKEVAGNDKKIELFKQRIAAHQWNVDVLWSQYKLEEDRIRKGPGSLVDLEKEKAYFIKVYQQDIAEGIRVEESRKAIAEIEAEYAKKYATQEATENKQIAKLQSLLESELKKEEKSFNALKKRNAKLVNEQTESLIREAEQHFAQSAERFNTLKEASAVAAM